MQNLVNILFLIVTTTSALPLSSQHGTTLSCSNGLAPVFTNETFCTPSPSQKIFTCCHGNENNFEKENPFTTEPRNVLEKQFGGMKRGLEEGARLLGGLTCTNPNTTNLLKTTATSLTKLASVDWTNLLSDNGSNFECRIKIARATLCGSGECAPLPLLLTTPLPCHSLCLNLLRGCHHSLSENVLLPWKYAINSVRTAIRLLITGQHNCEDVVKEIGFVEHLHGNMNGAWREPFNWVDGICDLRGGASDEDCFAGGFGVEGLPLATNYDRATPTWSTNAAKFSNPEFKQNSEFSLEYESKIGVVREELLGVSKHLEKYWPHSQQTDSSNHTHPTHSTQSDESFGSYDDEDEEDDEDEYEDEENEFNSSGSGFYDNNNNFQTDDEDLLRNNNEGGSGEGPSNHDNDLATNEIIPTTDIVMEMEVNNKSCGGNLVGNSFLMVILIFVWLG